MSDACGCGHVDAVNEAEETKREPERLWEITELRAAAVAGVLLVGGYAVGWFLADILITFGAAALLWGTVRESRHESSTLTTL